MESWRAELFRLTWCILFEPLQRYNVITEDSVEIQRHSNLRWHQQIKRTSLRAMAHKVSHGDTLAVSDTYTYVFWGVDLVDAAFGLKP